MLFKGRNPVRFANAVLFTSLRFVAPPESMGFIEHSLTRAGSSQLMREQKAIL